MSTKTTISAFTREQAERPYDRECKPEQGADDHHRRCDLDRHHHALHDGGEIPLDHVPIEERVEKARPSLHGGLSARSRRRRRGCAARWAPKTSVAAAPPLR